MVLSDPSILDEATRGVRVPFKTSICGLGIACADLTAKRADSTALDAPWMALLFASIMLSSSCKLKALVRVCPFVAEHARTRQLV